MCGDMVAGGMIRGKPTEQKKKDFSDMVDELYPHLSRTTRNSLEVGPTPPSST
jgi:hypothetical protein